MSGVRAFVFGSSGSEMLSHDAAFIGAPTAAGAGYLMEGKSSCVSTVSKSLLALPGSHHTPESN